MSIDKDISIVEFFCLVIFLAIVPFAFLCPSILFLPQDPPEPICYAGVGVFVVDGEYQRDMAAGEYKFYCNDQEGSEE